VVVIGGGAAGAAAALAAAGAGAPTTLVSRAPGATALSSGAVDLAGDPLEAPGDPWAGRRPVSEAYRDLLRLSPGHPLAVAGVDPDRAQRILQTLCLRLPPLSFRPLDRPPLVLPTDLGTFKSTTLCGVWAEPGHLPDLSGGRLGVVGLRGHPLLDPAALAASLQWLAARGGIPLQALPLEVEVLRLRGEGLAHPPELAALLERGAARERLTTELSRACRARRLTALALPPVMGLDHWQELMDRLRSALPCPCFELLSSAPASVPGQRLQRALDTALERSGVRRLRGRVTTLLGHDGRLGAALLQGGQRLAGRAFVLATGSFIGGGLTHDRRLREPLLGLPVWAGRSGPDPKHLGKLLDSKVSGPHPLLQAGIRVDRRLSPLGRHGGPAQPNLFSAGSLLAGHDPVASRSGLGTALVTGHLAGEQAAGEAQR
jgi:glycerol-3-phosphate dehydrogenase subunit B